jgi:ABC-2 type transport system ATP-binding protein
MCAEDAHNVQDATPVQLAPALWPPVAPRVRSTEMSGVRETAILTEGLRKSYGQVQALDGVDLAIPHGTVFGLLGPNGAGKTTCVRILTTLLVPDSGRAEVGGLDVVRDATLLRARIGLAGQYAAIDENLTGFENLEMVGRLYHLSRSGSTARARELLERFELSDAGDRLAKTYSGGMRRRLDLAGALVARPPILFLDEPTTGLDPRSRLGMWDMITELVGEGTTVLLTTQYLEEADHLADQIAVIDHGRVIAEGTSDELKDQYGGERIEVVLGETADRDRALEALGPMADGPGGIGAVDIEGRTVRVPVRARPGVLADAVRRLDEAGVELEDLEVHRPTLDDVFLSLTGHAAEEAAEGEGEQAEAGAS